MVVPAGDNTFSSVMTSESLVRFFTKTRGERLCAPLSVGVVGRRSARLSVLPAAPCRPCIAGKLERLAAQASRSGSPSCAGRWAENLGSGNTTACCRSIPVVRRPPILAGHRLRCNRTRFGLVCVYNAGPCLLPSVSSLLVPNAPPAGDHRHRRWQHGWLRGNHISPPDGSSHPDFSRQVKSRQARRH